MSQVYQTMKIEKLSQMIPFFDFLIVEKISVDAVKHSFISLKVDHAKGVVLFSNQVSYRLPPCLGVIICMVCQDVYLVFQIMSVCLHLL